MEPPPSRDWREELIDYVFGLAVIAAGVVLVLFVVLHVLPLTMAIVQTPP